jgi:aspartyl-tRNA(Asn)/glutamyl-tRNA(Gln) amidotransferase subunit B
MKLFGGYEAIIGLEVHAQLQTESKLFCSCRVAYGEPPNSLTCPVCLGLPGALPVLNKKAVEHAMRAILATGGEVRNRSVFARKNYFYPDLPKGYQISQYDQPVGMGGAVRYRSESGEETICRLIRIHLEEDAGKLLHPEKGEGYSRVDLNRCGTPLIEIVSEADLRTPEDAYSYLVTLKQILQYLEVCTGDMEKGHLRCDANVSVRPAGETKLGTRTEVKNMNSFKGVERALKFEIERQVSLLESGGEVAQETLLWDEKRQVAEAMRGKEESHDYRYFPEPDLVILEISEEWIDKTLQSLPELPEHKTERFVTQYGIRPYDAVVLTESRGLADYFEETAALCGDAHAVSNWLQTELLGVLNETGEDIARFKVRPKMVAELLNLVKSGEISGKIAKSVFEEMTQTGREASAIVSERGLAQISDDAELIPIVEKILADNPESIAKYKGGRRNVFGFFVGQVMKATNGQANPELVNRLLKERLGE